ncbi:hypothetical protein GALMADRAFT_222328 [Galerina marginata CBS 339.88]|uniref:Uncharacterized protein n=1 Tax=Galerina marginata (strain CBS 339.88) TaxID=685588 RepID=A0A067TLC4_GALM3|nr:hypothetical protein GALMADRAFT_222328 [Galerina marginata CBS 339.88]
MANDAVSGRSFIVESRVFSFIVSLRLIGYPLVLGYFRHSDDLSGEIFTGLWNFHNLSSRNPFVYPDPRHMLPT